MIKINKNHDLYNSIADIVASIFGLGASFLVGCFCDSMISVQQDAGPLKKGTLTLGKMGLETIAMYTVSSKMREEIDDGVDAYNEFTGVVDTYKEKKALDAKAKEKYLSYTENERNEGRAV